jgi:hypothetical protein
MSTFLPAEKGMTIRQPSTANLMVDSADRDIVRNPSPADFQISRPQALLNGFFTRIATTEVVLEYNTFNVTGATLTIDVSGGTVSNFICFAGNYTVAMLIDFVVAQLTAKLPGTTWAVVPFAGTGLPVVRIAITAGAPVTIKLSGKVADLLGITSTTYQTYATNGGPAVRYNVDLRPFRYLDFVSAQLTYNQDLKDATTNLNVRDVLCRWYMDWDEPPAYDKYGFPILMGYLPFQMRRIFSPPKQIRWDNMQSLGSLEFQVYDNTGVLAPLVSSTGNYVSNWLMTLQVSEN